MSFIFLVFGVLRFKNTEEFIVPKKILSNKLFLISNLTHFFIGVGLIIAIITVPVMAETILGASPLEGGLRLLRLTIALSIGAFIGGLMTEKINSKIPLMAGFILISVGFYFMFGWGLDIGDPEMTIHLSLLGLGFGICISPITYSAMKNINDTERGSASSLLTLSRMLGMTIGLSSLTAWGTTRFSQLTSDVEGFSLDPLAQQKLTETTLNSGLQVFQEFFLIGLIVCIISIPIGYIMTSIKK